MHGLDCCWSELFLLASHPVKRGCTSSLSLGNTKVLLQNHTPLTAGVRVLAMHRSCPRQHLRPCLGFPSDEPQRYSHTTQQAAQHRNLPPGACFMKPTQSKLLLFAPAATKSLFRSPSSFVLPHLAWSCLCFPHPRQLWFFLPLTQGIRLRNVSRACSPGQLCCQCRQGAS